MHPASNPASNPARPVFQSLLYHDAALEATGDVVQEHVKPSSEDHDAHPEPGDQGTSQFHHIPRDSNIQTSRRGFVSYTDGREERSATVTKHADTPPATLPRDERLEMGDAQELAALPDKAVIKYRKVAQLQDKFLAIQTSLKSERDAATSILVRVVEGQTHMADLLNSNSHFKRRSSTGKQWQQLHTRLMEDQSAFQAQMQHVSDVEQSLGKLEYRLAKMQPELLQVLAQRFVLGHQADLADSSVGSGDSPQTSSDMDPLEAEYYNKRGDVRRLQDQLIDHQAEFRTPPGDQSPLPGFVTQAMTEDSASYVQSAAFRTKWQLDHDALRHQLHQAEQELTRLWNLCQAASLDVGSLSTELAGHFEYPPELSEHSPHNHSARELTAPPFLPQDSDGALPRFLRNLPWLQKEIPSHALVEELSKFAEKKQDIERWVSKLPFRQLSHVGVNDSPSIKFEHTLSLAHSDPDWALIQRSGGEEGSLKDYVLIPEERSNSAPNGEPLETNSGILRRVLRKWRSLDEMRRLSQSPRRPVHRASEDIRHGFRLPGS